MLANPIRTPIEELTHATTRLLSFHYESDVWRVNQIRNAPIALGTEKVGFWDAAEFEKVKRGGTTAIKKWIDGQMHMTSVTVVLIGEKTIESSFVKYEIQQSIELGKGLLGITIHNLKDQLGNTRRPGANPLPRGYPIYDWVTHSGYSNVGTWIETAARVAGR